MKQLIHSGQLRGHNIAVVGAGRSGLSAALLAKALGAHVRVLEKDKGYNTTRLQEMGLSDVEFICGDHEKEHFTGQQMVIISPGIPVQSVGNLLPENTPLYSELEFASWFIHEPIIAVTGTNGKTTTTLLTAHALKKSGFKVFAGGNLGTPLSEYVLDSNQCDILVLEVSSFQLEACSGFHPMVGVFLNFSDNHLDHHKSSADYFNAKTRLFAKQAENDLAVIDLALQDRMEAAGLLKGKRIYFVPGKRFSCPALAGEHNQANMEAAFQACRYFGIEPGTFQDAIYDFNPPAHRQEVFLKYQGKVFVNDSKATTTTAVSAALNAFDKPIRLLAGGVYKGGDFSQLVPLVTARVAKVYLYGSGREIFQEAWRDHTDVEYFPTMDQALDKALSEMQQGETMLLSPGTASFDQFSDYKDRGDTFKSLVLEKLNISTRNTDK